MRKCIKENISLEKENSKTINNFKQEEPEAAFYLKSIIHCKIRRLKIIKKNLPAADFETYYKEIYYNSS